LTDERCLECVTQAETSYIWAIYGPSITANGAICGLSTSPNTPPAAETSAEPEPTPTPTPTPEEPTTPTPTPESPETSKEAAPNGAEESVSPTTKPEETHAEETGHTELSASETNGHHAEETVVACAGCAPAASKTTAVGELPSTLTAAVSFSLILC
jgi:outer membrane biosynthesis protein TonB